MLNDSQHIGHSRPSSLLAHEETSSSEQSGLDGCAFFFMLPAMALDAKLHMLKEEELINYVLCICNPAVQQKIRTPHKRTNFYLHKRHFFCKTDHYYLD
jgi:hypothetical protein